MRERVETFEQYVDLKAPYFDAIRDAGDVPWFEDPEKRSAIISGLGLPADIEPIELRRALWERRSYTGTAA